VGFAKPLPVEVMTENTSDWNNRLGSNLANTNLTEINILLINSLPNKDINIVMKN
jgi:hypothetical protein